MHNPSWLVIIPPLVVFLVTLFFRQVLLSLAVGIIAATLIIHQGALLPALQHALLSLWHGVSNLDHLYTFGFLVLLGVLIQILSYSGGIQAYTRRLLTVVTTGVGAQKASLSLSTLLCIDDYVSNLAVGAIMQPITDHFKLPRAKLAFLLDSMSGPLCLLVPVTSWVAFIIGQLQPLIGYDPFLLYISCIPFLLYPLSIIFSAWIIVVKKISFGPMAHQEYIARTTGNLFDGKQPLVTTQAASFSRASVGDFLAPIGLFLVSFFLLLSWSGDSLWALFCASLMAVLVSVFWYTGKQVTFITHVPQLVLDGFRLMQNSLAVLLLAWTFGGLLKNDLHTGDYIASLIPASSLSFLPLIMCVFSLCITASTGSVWGTIALVLPISIPLYTQLAGAQAGLGLYALLGAIFSGAVAGSHFSPITDAMVMASTAAGCYHLDHVKTHMAYAWPALVGSLLGFASFALFTYPSVLVAALASITISLSSTYTILRTLNIYSRPIA